jgi:hypothetical protein
MYLAKHVGGWSLQKIGRSYNGRQHTAVLHAIAKIERLRKADEAFDSFLDILTETITSESNTLGASTSVSLAHVEVIDAVALRVIQHLKELPTNVGAAQIQAITNRTFDPMGVSARITAHGTIQPDNARYPKNNFRQYRARCL